MRVAVVLSLLILAIPAVSHAKDWQQCFGEAEAKYNLPKDILKAIATVESGFNPKAVNKSNKGGSVDRGVMQINSYHLKTLKGYGISKEDLFKPCLNIHVGAWILWDSIKRHGNTWKAVGAYNARSEDKRKVYVAKVAKAWRQYQ